MSAPSPGTVTQLLEAAGRGEGGAQSRLWTILKDELHQLAQRKLAHEPAACAIGSTSLVNEAYIKLTDGQPVQFANRKHFFAVAANLMRQILVDDARRRNRDKRGGGQSPISLKQDPVGSTRDAAEILAVHEALDRLEKIDSRKAEVVKYRFFAEMTGEETAEVLGVSARTVDSEWQFARAWLHREFTKGDGPPK